MKVYDICYSVIQTEKHFYKLRIEAESKESLLDLLKNDYYSFKDPGKYQGSDLLEGEPPEIIEIKEVK